MFTTSNQFYKLKKDVNKLFLNQTYVVKFCAYLPTLLDFDLLKVNILYSSFYCKPLAQCLAPTGCSVNMY